MIQKSKNSTHLNKRDSELESLLFSEHTVEIEKLVVGGNGLARLTHKDRNLVVFVPLSAPQDKLLVQITKVEKNHLEAKILKILMPSPNRRAAPCSYFENCGGCTWQHIDEKIQIEQKELILKDLLRKFVPDLQYDLLPTVISPKQWNYRNRIQLKQKKLQIGYYKRGTNDLVEVEQCLIADSRLSEQIPLIKKTLKPTEEVKKFEIRLNTDNQIESYPIGEDGEGLSFSQVNTELNAKLVEAVLTLIKYAKPESLTELYAGAGNFTFPILNSDPKIEIEAVEMNSKLTFHASKIIRDLNLQKRISFFTSNCESFVKRRKLSKNLVLLDPPRSGCSDIVLDKILSAAPKHILYISCGPAFLVRDLKQLTGTRAYQLKHLQIFDMFPQTDHFETCVFLERTY